MNHLNMYPVIEVSESGGLSRPDVRCVIDRGEAAVSFVIMPAISFFVLGSAEAPYRLVFKRTRNEVRAYCDCSGFRFGGFCKHVLGLLRGEEIKGLQEGAEHLPVLVEWVAESELPKILEGLAAQEKAASAAKREAARFKKRLKEMIGSSSHG